MNIEKKIVFLSILLLVVSNVLIYILFFNIRGEVINISNLKVSNNNIQKPQNVKLEITWNNETMPPQLSWENIFDTGLEDIEFGKTWVLTWELSWNILLSGTILYTWQIESLDLLWIVPKYTLTDENNVLYSYLWTGEIDMKDKVKLLSWNLVEIKDKNIINTNMLFGDILTYINIPTYKWVKTIFMVKFDNTGDLWLLQVDYDKYHKLKKHFKNLFNY